MMFRIVIAAAALALTALTPIARAQNPQANMQAEYAAFQKSLNVTPDQQKKIMAINKKYQPKMMAIQKKYEPEAKKIQQTAKPDDPKAKQALMALMKKFTTEAKPVEAARRKELMPVFTPEQRKKITAFEAKMKKMGMGG